MTTGRRLRRGWSTPGPVYRVRPEVRLATTAFSIWWSAVSVVVILDRPNPWQLVQLGLVTALLSAVVIPARRVCVVATPLGLRVNNGWRERRLRWSDIAGFQAEQVAVGQLVVVLRSGERIELKATRCWLIAGTARRRQRLRTGREQLATYGALVVADGDTVASS